jgi:hypothetical protein
MSSPILAPAAVLVLWSLVVLHWVLITRMKAFAGAGITMSGAPAGVRYQDLEAQLPANVNWKSHNWTHLMEQPTLFYATVAILALAGHGDGINLALAWAYTGLRILHSLWQGTVNTLNVRAPLFFLYTLSLLILSINAVRVTVF